MLIVIVALLVVIIVLLLFGLLAVVNLAQSLSSQNEHASDRRGLGARFSETLASFRRKKHFSQEPKIGVGGDTEMPHRNTEPTSPLHH
mmetsp:Transcript_17571/g.60787  ORF Transcript_17571/g.60787 Transcript_17571/m.60787 type:complete len:88 (+) Transcript_17571:2-265(+)